MKTSRTSPSKKKTRRSNTTARRESGEPGGGKGRRDVARGSGVYPVSGPWPRQNAEIRTEASWGQGELGPAGYQESGESGLESVLGRSGIRKPGRRAKSIGRQPAQRRETEREIPKRQWEKFCDEFSRQHDGWLAEVEVREPHSRSRLEVRRLPFHGITVDLKRGARNTTSIILDLQANVHLTHMVPHTKRIVLKEIPQGLELEITSAGGERTIARFLAPRRVTPLLPPPTP